MEKAYILPAIKLRKEMFDNQILIVYRYIVNAAELGRTKAIIRLEYLLSEECLNYFIQNGYQIQKLIYNEDKDSVNVKYEIRW